MAKYILLDSSVYVYALRSGDWSILDTRSYNDGLLWLSAVVLEELYAGCTTAKQRKLFLALESDFRNNNRMLVPDLSDWTKVGYLLSMLGQKYGYEEIGRARMTNDALIAVSARRQGITILTKNGKDFEKLSKFYTFDFEVG